MRLRALALAAIALCLTISLALPAAAHTRSETHSSWRVVGSMIYLAFTVPDGEARRLTTDGSLAAPVPIANYLAPRLGATDDGRPCPRVGKPEPVAATSGVTRVEFVFNCPGAKALKVFDHAFFERVPTHTNFAQIQTADGEFIEQLMTKDQQTLDASGSAANPLQNASFLKYIQLGVLHIFTGLDHQAFLLGLVLLSRRLRDLTFVITGFTLGHSATLALAVTGVLRPHAEFIDALIGLTIALVGAEKIAESSGRPGLVASSAGFLLLTMGAIRLAGVGSMPVLLLVGGGLFAASYLTMAGHLRDAARLRLLVTLVFGLVHGFGFAANLLEMQLPKGRLAELLVGFNLGVELGQLTIVLALVGLGLLLTRLKLALPRPMVVDVGSSFLVGLGLFWFVIRSYA
jgi:hypothetical protein